MVKNIILPSWLNTSYPNISMAIDTITGNKIKLTLSSFYTIEPEDAYLIFEYDTHSIQLLQLYFRNELKSDLLENLKSNNWKLGIKMAGEELENLLCKKVFHNDEFPEIELSIVCFQNQVQLKIYNRHF